MANKGHGWLYITEESGGIGELVNHARTAAYLQSSAAIGCGTVSNVLDDGGCEAYTWIPDEDGVWVQDVFTTPEIDGAPWYSAAYPESAQALGFWITEWTGLDSGHIRRTTTPIGAYRGGSVLGLPSNAGRVMGFEMLMLAESEKAMEYLFQWFDSTISSVCSTCATDTILVRRYCTEDVLTAATADDGVVEIRGVGLVSGMVYGEDPVEQAGCFLRRVNFTLEASDPCMYSICTGEEIDSPMDWRDCFALSEGFSTGRPECRPDCAEVSASCRAVYNYTIDTPSASAPIITLQVPGPVTNTGGTYTSTVPLRIRTYSNPYGAVADEICALPLLAELYLTGLPAYSEIKYDMAARRVQYRDAGSGEWGNGFAFVEPNTVGIPRFAGLGCGDYTTIIEPSNFCVDPTVITPEAGTFLSDGSISTVAEHPTLGIAIGGSQTVFGPVTQTGFGIITELGRNVLFALGITGATSVNKVVVQPDGMMLLAGSFTTMLATTVNRVVRVRTNATIDPLWDLTGTPGVANTVHTIARESSGKILVGGQFTTMRGTTRNCLGRLNSNGTLDTAFNPSGALVSTTTVYDFAIQDDGMIVVGGDFSAMHSTTKNGIARINSATGAADTTFNIGTNPGLGVGGIAFSLAIQPDGKILVGGQFTAARGVSKNNICRLNTDGTLDTTFNTGGSIGVTGGAGIRSIALLEDGSIVAGGSFTTARGVTVKRIVRLTDTGAIHPEWNTTVAGASNGEFRSVVEDEHGKILVGGATWTSVSGFSRRGFARLNRDGTIDGSMPAAQVYYPGELLPDSEMSLQERMGCV